MSKSSVYAVTKLLRLKPHKFTIVRKSRIQTVLRRYGFVTGYVKQVQWCNRCFDNLFYRRGAVLVERPQK